MFKQNLIKQVNFNSIMIWLIAAFLTTTALVLLVTPFELLEQIPDLSLSRRLGIPYAPTYGLTRAIWCVFHGKLALAVKYNRLVYLFLPMLTIQYLGLVRQCYRYHMPPKLAVNKNFGDRAAQHNS
ncbi:DUF2752 domain-containing protein (plasmid) [Kovacikia minuta CCNUW1]|uniref:DUF2752 domain-containing protein n=1 Tax=Kovacikia minuta TaxID=2931930 RepID=UPI001CCBDDE2|nr:DUF2752 domain-containing protein [Kovacikia minuta]UBF30249.1 DUF2752 domain-containing protein [Kovacikia minuta CCNUW1]